MVLLGESSEAIEVLRSTCTSSPARVFALALIQTLFALSPAAAQLTGAPHASVSIVSRGEAILFAIQHSPRERLFRADSAAAAAELALARQFDNPTVSAAYSKSEPQAHFALDIPIDWPRARQPRINAARSNAMVATMRNIFGRRALELDVDTAYTRAQAQAARAMLSQQTARDADSLLVIAKVRRDAGDASDLDVELATVFDGQLQNMALTDSLAEIAARVSLQLLMGLSPDSTQVVLSEAISLVDSVIIETNAVSRPNGLTNNRALLPVAVAEGEVETANFRVLAEQRRRLAAPSLSVGFETVNSGTNGPLPTVGFAMPLPIFHRNSASIQATQAELLRAQANLIVAHLQQDALVANAKRDASTARIRLARSRRLVASANRIATMSITAYREGASPIGTVLDAQRSAREALSQYADDVAAVRIADSVLRFVTLSTDQPRP